MAVEQARGSVPLHEFDFTRRGEGMPIVLLLGAEKEGVPATLLSLVDACVEIPQAGLLRSLNVHVSCSLALWEITRQRLLHEQRHPAGHDA